MHVLLCIFHHCGLVLFRPNQYLFGAKAVKLYSAIVLIFIMVGSMLKVDLVWALSDLFNGLMVIPNLLALLALSGLVSKLYKEYQQKKVIKSD